MLEARPSVAEARGIALTRRLREWKSLGLIATVPSLEAEAKWRRSSPMLRLVLFALTLLAVMAFYYLIRLLDLPPGWVTVIAACGLAELLIRRKHFFHVGPEEALFLGGWLAWIFGLPGPQRLEGIVLFAGAALLSAWRLQNQIFLVIATLLLAFYVHVRLETPLVSFLIALTVSAAAAWILFRRRIRRPWVAGALQMLVIIFPLVAYIVAKEEVGGHELLISKTGVPLMGSIAAMGVAFAIGGVKRKARAVLLSSFLILILLGIEMGLALPYRPEILLIAAGLALLGLAFFLSRVLRTEPRGWTARKLDTKSDLPVTGAAAFFLHPPAAAPASPSPDVETDQGSSFGGGGAGGTY